MPTSNRKRYLDSLVAESSRNSNRARTYSDRRRQLDEIVKISEQNTARRAEAAQRNTTVPTPTAKSPNATMDRNALRRNATAEGYRQNMERRNTAQYDASEQELRKPQTTVQSTSKAGQVAELAATKALEAQSVKMRADENKSRAQYEKWNKLDDNAKKLANTAYSSAWDVSLDERIAAEHELKSKYNMTDKDLKDVRKGRKYERRYADSLLKDERLSKMYNDLGTEGQELLRTYGNKGVQLLGGQELSSESRHAENELRTKYKLNDQDLSQLSVYAEQYENQQKYNAEDTIKEAQERARKHPIRTSAETIVSNVLGNAMSAVGQGVEAVNLARLRQSGYDAPVSIDRNNPLFAATRYTNQARQTVAEEKIDSRIGSFLYQTGMSAIDSGVAAGIGAMFPAGSIGQLSLSLGGTMLGVGAGTSTMLDLADKGASAETALLGGFVSGALEMLFEDVSISQLSTFKKTEAAAFKSGLSKAAIKDNLKLLAKKWGATTFTNATEEGFTEIANLIYDTAVNGDFSQYREYYNDAIKNGITDPAQAQLYAIKNMTMQVLEAAAGGALMGGVFGMGGAAKLGVNYRQQYKGAQRLGGIISADSGRADVINTAEAMPEGSESRELLNKYQNSKKGLTSNRIGRLAVANEEFLMGADEDTVKKVEAARREVIQTKAGEAQRNFDRFELNNAVVGTDKSGREIRMVDANANKQGAQAKIFSKGANGALTFKTSDGKTQVLNKQSVNNIQNADTRSMAKFALDNKLGAEGANLLFDSYNPETLTGDHEAAFLRVYRQGALGTSSKALFGNYGDDMRQFTAEQQQKILNAGLAEKETKPGTTDWRVYTKNNGFLSLQIKAMDAVNKALGRELYVVDDLYETYTAKDENGNDVKRMRYLNGQYLKDSGKIILSANADKGLLLSFLGHEMGHEMKVNDRAIYDRLVSEVKSHYTGDEWDKQIKKFVDMGYDESDVEEEIVCNSLFDVFDRKTISKIFGKDKAAAVRAYKTLARISSLYNSAISEYANALDYKGEYKHGDIKKLRESGDFVDKTRELFAEYLGKYAAGEYEGVKNNEAAKNSISDREYLPNLETEINNAGLILTSKENNKNNLRINAWLREHYPDYVVDFFNDRDQGYVTIKRIQTRDEYEAQQNKQLERYRQEQQERIKRDNFFKKYANHNHIGELRDKIERRLAKDFPDADLEKSHSIVGTLSFYVTKYNEDGQNTVIKISDHNTAGQEFYNPSTIFIDLHEVAGVDDLYNKIKKYLSDDSNTKNSISDRDAEYEEAYFDGDDEKMQTIIDEEAKDAGYKYKGYHHTENSFTEFDLNRARKTSDIQGFYFSADPDAESEYGSARYDVYLKMSNPYVVDSAEKAKAIPFDLSKNNSGVTARQWLLDNGYDSVIRKAEYYGADADEYIVLNSNQIKSAEPMTYDDNDEIIYPSQRFDAAEKDIRYSLSDRDTEYMQAVKLGNEAEQQKLVDEAAKASKYTPLRLFHGTDGWKAPFGFTKVDFNFSDDGQTFFMTDSLEGAATYSGTDKVRKISDTTEKLDKKADKAWLTYKDSTYDLARTVNDNLADSEWEWALTADDIQRALEYVGERYDDAYFGMDRLPAEAAKSIGEAIDEAYGPYASEEFKDDIDSAVAAWVDYVDSRQDVDRGNQGIYQLYANTDGFFEYDADGRYWNELDFKADGVDYPMTRDVAKYALDNGYKGVIIRNVRDNGNYGDTPPINVYVAFSAEQVKSADPITYDDNGNVIPLSERFNPENKDIRYSISDRDEQEAVNQLGANADVQTNDKGELVLATDKEKKTAMYSVRTWKDSGRDALANLLRAKGHTQAEIDDQLKTIDDAADYLQILAAGFAENEGYHDLSQHLVADVTTDVAHGKQVVSALVPNGEYPVNIDLALICKKRVAYMKLITRLIDDGVMENVRFGGDAIADVNAILRDNGFETACLGCFVESRRLQIQTWAETIAQEWNEAVDKVRKNAPYFNFAQKGKENAGNLTQEEMDDLDEWLSKQELNDQGNVKTGGRSPLARAEGLLQMVAESGDGKALDAIAKKITVGDLLTPQGLTEMKRIKGGSNIISFVKSRYGSNTPKIVQEYNPYNSEIAIMTAKAVADLTGKSITGLSVYRDSAKEALADSKPKPKDKEAKAKWDADVEHLALQNYFKDIGGIRIQSFSDFMIENVFDYLQIVADLAAQDFSMHGYSKEITALRLFGMTGIKWNGSFIAHVDPKMGKEYAGLMPASEADAHRGIPVELDGKKYTICMDDYERHNKYDKNSYIQSIGYKDMIALQCDKRYAPYVGSITIGVSDNQIRAMLRSDYFRMVIPYHSSGMNPIFAQLMGVDYYTDYTDYQNTRLAQLYDVDGNEVDTLGEDIEPDHFLFNAKVQELGDAKAAADAYLAWCAERHEIKKGDEVIGYATYEPKFSKFSNEENYYKLLEDFNVYDSITGESAIQGGAKMILPSADNKLSKAELEEYRDKLIKTGLFSEEKDEKTGLSEIDKYVAKAQQTFQEIVQDAVQERAAYNKDVVVPKFDDTVSQIEKLLTDKYSRETKAAKGVYQTVNSNNWGVPQVGLGNIANTSVSGNTKASISDRGDVADYEAEQYLENASAEEIKAIVDEVDRRMQNAPYFEDKQEQTEVYAILDKMREKRDRLYEALSMDTGNESLTEYNRNTRNKMFGEAEPEGTIEGNKLIGKGQRQNIKKADAEKLIKRYKNVHHDRGAPLSLENLDEATAKLQQFYEDMQNNPNMAWDEVYDKAKDVAVEVIKFTKRHKEVSHPGKIYQQTYNTRYYNLFNDYTDDTGRNYGREAISDSFVLKPGAEEWLAPIINDIVTDYFDVPVSNADAVKTANLKTTYKNQIQSLKNQIRAIQKEHRAEVKQKVKAQKLADDIYYKRRMQEIRADRDQKLLAQRIAYQQSQQNRREQKAQRDLKGKIYRRYQRLDQELRKPSGNKYVPKDLVNTVAGVLSQLTDTLQSEEYYQTGREIKSHIAQNKKLADLKVVYDAMAKDERYSNYYDPVISEMMQELARNTKGKTINEMGTAELQQVYTLMAALDHTVRQAAKVEIAGKEHDAFKLAEQTIKQANSTKQKKINGFTKFWYDQMNARSFFRQLSGYTDGGWMDMYDMLNEGQLKQSAIKAEVTEAFNELTSDKQARNLMDTKKLYDIGLKDKSGKPIKLTKGMILAIYMHLQNEQNIKHIAEGGLTVPDLEKYYKGDREAYGNTATYSSSVAGELSQLNMQINELEKKRTDANAAETDAKIEALKAKKEAAYEKADALMDNLRMQIEKQLTDYDRAWITKAKWFFDEYSKGKLNEATMQMYGFNKANENNYFPIKVDKTMIAPSFDGLKRDITLEGSGFMKDRQKGAANPIYLEDMVDVIKRQMNNVSAYAGLAPAIKNFEKVYGKSMVTGDADVTSVQKAVNNAFGQYGKKYISDLITDLQGGRKGEPSILTTLRGNAYQAALTLNLRVAMAQAGSYPTAAAEIGWKPLMKALRRGGEKNSILSKADRDLIAKYTPLLANRVNGGNSTVDLNNLKTLSARSAKGLNARILQKTAPLTDWISKVDAATVGRLWYAAQYYVDDNNPKLQKGTDEYYQEVAKVFNRIVERTQPSYTTMQRSALLRNPNEAQKFFTMYMTQRSQNFNLLYDSAMEYNAMRAGAKNGTVSQEQLKKSATNLRRVVSSQLAAGLTLSAMKIVADAIQHNMKGYRDDDEDEVTAEKILEKLGTTWLESEISNVFLGSEIYSLVSSMITGEAYYGISVNVTGALTDFTKNIVTMAQNPSAKSIDRVFRDAANIMGIPSTQINKFVNMGKYWYQDLVDGGGIYSNYEGAEGNKQMVGKMVAAYLRGDMAQYRTRSEALGDKSDSSVKSAITSYVEEQMLAGKMSEPEARRVFLNVYGKSEKETDKKLEEIRQKKAGTYEKKESKKWGG